MPTTIRELVSSADVQLQQLSPDSKIPTTQLFVWGTWLVNKYRAFQAKSVDTGSYLSIMPAVTVSKAATTTTPDIIAGEKYSALPRAILDLEGDRGIDYVSYARNDYPDNVDLGIIGPFTRTTPRKARWLYNSKYTKPTASNPYWYRHGNYVGFVGISNANISTVEMGLLTSFDPFADHDIDDHLDILTDYGDEIFKDLIELGRFGLLVPQDRINDGADTGQAEQVPQQRVTSVNKSVEGLLNTEQE